METVRVGADDDAAWDVAVAIDSRAGGRMGRGDARLLGRRGGVETEGFLEDVVEEGEGVEGAGGGETMVAVRRVFVGGDSVGIPVSRVEDRRVKGEEFGAETILEVRALREFVHEVRERDA